jgi:hypothetical protein
MFDKQEEKSMKNKWDKTEIIIKIIGSLLVPFLLLFYGNKINNTLKEKELDIKYLEIATGILSRDPAKTPPSLRDWAVDILKFYSKEVPLSSDAATELKEKPLPTSRFITDEKGNIITDEKGNPISF